MTSSETSRGTDTDGSGRDGSGAAAPRHSVISNVVRGSLGNLIESYDWYAYAAFSIYFASSFFPKGNPTAELLNTAGVFAVGFLMRPIGGWLLDATPTASAAAALTLSVTLMAVGSLVIAATPSYSVIGGLAPVILVLARRLPGLSSEVSTARRRRTCPRWPRRGSGASTRRSGTSR